MSAWECAVCGAPSDTAICRPCLRMWDAKDSLVDLLKRKGYKDPIGVLWGVQHTMAAQDRLVKMFDEENRNE